MVEKWHRIHLHCGQALHVEEINWESHAIIILSEQLYGCQSVQLGSSVYITMLYTGMQNVQIVHYNIDNVYCTIILYNKDPKETMSN